MVMSQRILPAVWVVLSASALVSAQATRPSLNGLDSDVQQLFRDAQQRIVRVTVPITLPTRVLEQEHPLTKWGGQLDPALRQKLEVARARGEPIRVFIERRPATSTAPSAQTGESSRIPFPATTVVNAEFLGLVLNKTGDVLVPLYIDRAYLQSPLRVALDDRRMTSAIVVGADRQTSLSVIRLNQPAGEPVRFADSKLAAGSVVLSLSPTRRTARLSVWSGGDENSVVVNTGGEIAAIVRNGHTLYPRTFMPIVEQLLSDNHTVRRAQLGVYIRDVANEDSQRGKLALLGARAAARVEDIEENSVAHRAGLQVGDLIIGLGNEPIEDVVSFAAAIANRRGKTDLRIIREGKEQTIAVDLQAN